MDNQQKQQGNYWRDECRNGRFPSIAIEHGCIGSTFAEDDDRIIVFTKWSDEMTLEAFRSSQDYKMKEVKIIQAFVNAGFEIPNDILFNSTAGILFTN